MATQWLKEKIKIAIKEFFEETPTDEAIWKGMRHRDITKKIQDFLWKHTHGIYRLGIFWTHIPGFEDRAECPICGKYDTFKHIMLECDLVEQKTVWDQANKLWRQRHSKDLHISEGTILGGGLAKFKRENGRPDGAKNRLYRILITESVHLIWVLLCERRIAKGDNPHDYHTEQGVRDRWFRKMNERLQIDCLLTNSFLYEKKALKTRKVYDTWAKCSTNTEDTHHKWCRNPGLLVGMTPRCPLGQHR